MLRGCMSEVARAKAEEKAAQDALDAAEKHREESEAAAKAAIAAGDMRAQAEAEAEQEKAKAEQADAERKQGLAQKMRSHAERAMTKAKQKEQEETAAVSQGANVWANVMKTRNLSTRLNTWKAWIEQRKHHRSADDKLCALFNQRADKHWIPLQIVREWFRVYQRQEKMRVEVRKRKAAQREQCFIDWRKESGALRLRRHQVVRWVAVCMREWLGAAVRRRNRRNAAGAFEQLKRSRMLAGWKMTTRAVKLRNIRLKQAGLDGFVENVGLQDWGRSALVAWKKRIHAEGVSKQAAARYTVKKRIEAWWAWCAYHRLVATAKVLREKTAKRVLYDGWDGWKKLHRLAPRLSPSQMLTTSSSLYLPKSRTRTIWSLWSGYMRQKREWRQEELEDWARYKVLERHLACGNRRKAMVCFIYWKHLYVNKLHSVGATTCAAHSRLARSLRAWVDALDDAKSDRAAVSLAAAQHCRTTRTTVLYALHRRAVFRRALRRAARRADQIHRLRVGGSALRALHEATSVWRADRAVGCFTGWAAFTTAVKAGSKSNRSRLREDLLDIMYAWTMWATIVSGRHAAETLVASTFSHWARHVRCLRNARQRQEWAQSALALIPGASGLGGSSAALTQELLQELAVVRAISAFRDRLVGRRVLRALHWYATTGGNWRAVVALLVSSLRGPSGVFLRCRFRAWQAWASHTAMARSADDANEIIADRWWTRRWQVAVFKPWREMATAAAMRRIRAVQIGRARTGAASRQLRQVVWFEWSEAFARRRLAEARGAVARAQLLHAVVSAWRGQVVHLRQAAAQWQDVVVFDRRQRCADVFYRWTVFTSSESRAQMDEAVTQPVDDYAEPMDRFSPRAIAASGSRMSGPGLARHSVAWLTNRTRGSSATPATPRTPFHHGHFPGRARSVGVATAVGSCVGSPSAESRALIARYSTPRRAPPRAIAADDDNVVSGVLFE